MADKLKGWVINDDEFKFLSEMVPDTENAESQSKPLEFDISSDNDKENLLFQLELADKLQLFADYGNHRLVFPVEINRGDFTNFNVALQPPKIYEKGDHLRLWRLPVDEALCLLNAKGELLNYQIKDLSASGMSLLMNNDKQNIFPEKLNNIYLQLPNGERLAISATKTRRVNKNTVAYSLAVAIDDTVLSSLSEYLFECHSTQYPEFYENRDSLMFI